MIATDMLDTANSNILSLRLPLRGVWTDNGPARSNVES